jgi:acetyl esterase/lipase
MYAGFTVKRDIVYGHAGDRDLALDLYLPNHPLRPVPILVYVHGGGWSALDKSWCPYPMRLLEQEYAVASVDYRLLDQGGQFPANLHDCKAAVRWVRAHAAAYGLDGDHIAVWGDSAGAHLAAMVGLTGDRPELEGDVGTPGVSSRIQAVCTYFGVFDLVAMVESSPHPALIERLTGAIPPAEHLDRVRAASPISYVSAEAPPFLILHGDVDTSVPVSQSVLFYEALWKAGADVRLHIVHGGEHLSFYRSPADIPWHATEVVELEDAFFYRTLKSHERAAHDAG